MTVCCLADPVVGAAEETCEQGLAHGCVCADSTNPFTLVRELEERLTCLRQRAALETESLLRTGQRDARTSSPLELTEAAETTNSKLSEAKDLVSFLKGNFGIGLFAGHGLGGTRIESARLEHNRVVVDRDTTNRGAVVFEYHRFPWHFRDGGFGLGAFAMVSSIPDELTKIDSFGTGLMFGFRDLLQGKAFLNVGLGIALDRDVKQLAPGFVAGELAPLDAERKPIEPGLQTKSAYSLFFLVSFTPKIGGS